MIDAVTTDLIWQTLRILLLIVAPLLAATSLAGIVVAALQAMTSIHDPASGFAVRLAGLALVVYLLWPTWSSMIVGLTESVFMGR